MVIISISMSNLTHYTHYFTILLRVLAGYMHVAKTVYNAHLFFTWDVNVECPGHFLQIFQPLEGVSFISNSSRVHLEKTAKKVFPNVAHRFELIMDESEIPRKNKHWAHCERASYEKFLPLKEIQDKVDDYVLKNNIENCSAMHLRQTDMHLVLNPRQRASLESYGRFLNTRPDDEKVFLMTDNPVGQKHHIDKYGSRVLVYSRIIDPNANNTATLSGNNIKNGTIKRGLNAHDNITLPSSYRFTSLEHTLIDILISANALVFKGSPFSSLSDLVNMYRGIVRDQKKIKKRALALS
jgi:hypothetical protein